MNNTCFQREIIHYNSSLFYHLIDACYLITMDNSSRRNRYISQLNTYKPFHKINIIHNKGFKKCKKEERIKNTADDLSDFYGKIFEECLQTNINKVLIFEDDFFFTEHIQKIQNYILDIQIFLDQHPNFMTYNLGPLSWFMCPSSLYSNHYIYKGGVAHCVVYSRRYMLEYVQHYKTMKCLSDYFWNRFHENYCYYKPLCFQLFPRTENSYNWNSYIDVNGIMQKVFYSDRTHEYIFPFTFFFAKIWYWVFLVIICKKYKLF